MAVCFPDDVRRSAELRRLLLESRVEQIVTVAPRAASLGRSEMGRTTSSAAQRRRAREKTKAHFSARERERRLASARIVASDAELIAQAVAGGRVRKVSFRHPNGEPEPQPAARNWKNSSPVGEQRWLR